MFGWFIYFGTMCLFFIIMFIMVIVNPHFMMGAKRKQNMAICEENLNTWHTANPDAKLKDAPFPDCLTKMAHV